MPSSFRHGRRRARRCWRWPPPSVFAKQIRINVTNFDFTPRYAPMNQGDHAVWIWNNSSHTVTQGDTADVPVTPTPGALFNSGDLRLPD